MSFVTYNEELIDATIAANQRSEVRTIVIAVVIVIIVIVVALLVYFIFRYLQNRNNGSGGGNSGGGGNNNGGGKCLTDANCPSSSPICLVATGLCVQCRDNNQCSGTISKCNPTTNSCVQCLTTTDCGDCQECRNNICQSLTTPPSPSIISAMYVGNDTLAVNWTPVAGAINYVIEYLSPGDTGLPGADAMLPQTVAGNLTTFTVPPGQGACAVSGLGNLYVTAITRCGRSARSVAFRLRGQGC